MFIFVRNIIQNQMDQLKSDMLELIKLSGEIEKYNQMLLHHIDLNDKRNYDEQKSERIRVKISEIQNRFYSLKEKWF